MPKIFFLSHSTQDGAIVSSVAEALGRDSCWYHPWESLPGDSILENVDKGLAECRVFVVFWSAWASRSNWVAEETGMARIRKFRDRGLKIVPVLLDDTQLPLALQNKHFLDGTVGSEYIAAELSRLKSTLVAEESLPGRTALGDPFQNRQNELADLEKLGLSNNYSGVLLLGLNGMGKTSLLKRASDDIFRHLNPIWIDLKLESSPARLLASISRPLSIAIHNDDIADDPEGLWRNRLLPELKDASSHYLILDNYPTPDVSAQNQKRTRLISAICHDVVNLEKKGNPNLVLISSAEPALDASVLARLAPVSVGELPSDPMRWALRARLGALMSLMPDETKITSLAKKLRGYPLAVNLVANKVAQQGIDAILEDPAFLSSLLRDLAQDLFAGIRLTRAEQKVLILMATASASAEMQLLRDGLGEDWRAVRDLVTKQIVYWNGAGFVLHDIIAHYVSEFLATAEEITSAHRILAAQYDKNWKSAGWQSADSVRYGSLALYHSIASGDERRASRIRSEYLTEIWEAGVELYRRRNIVEALACFEKVLEIDPDPDAIHYFYYALALNRRGRSGDALPIMQSLCDKYPGISRYWNGLGTVQRTLKELDDAEASFRRSVQEARFPGQKAVPLASLAEVLTDKGQRAEGLEVAMRARELAPRNSSVVATAAKLLQIDGQLERAYRIAADALKFNPNDRHLSFRIGVVLKESGDLSGARDHLQLAACDPSIPYSCTALADVYLELDNLSEADKALEKFTGDKRSDPSYLSTKGNILRKRGQLGEAEAFVAKALRNEPDNPIHLGGLAQIKLDQARKHFADRSKTLAELDLQKAWNLVKKGLALDGTNQILLTIQHSISQFGSDTGLNFFG